MTRTVHEAASNVQLATRTIVAVNKSLTKIRYSTLSLARYTVNSGYTVISLFSKVRQSV